MGWKKELTIIEQVALYSYVQQEGNCCTLVQERKQITADKPNALDERVYQRLYACKLPDRVGYEFIWISIVGSRLMDVRVITPDELEDFLLHWTTKLDHASGIIKTSEEKNKTPKFPRYRNMRTEK